MSTVGDISVLRANDVSVPVYDAFHFQSISDPSLVEDPAKDKQYSEPAVDDMRVQNDQVSSPITLLDTSQKVTICSR